MAQPASRQELIDYSLRRLGEPVVEINVADEQIDDLVDDALQYFQERHFDGVERMYLKYKLTEDDINRGTAQVGGTNTLGITSTQNNDAKYRTDKNGSMKVELNIYERYAHIKFLPYQSNGDIISPINGYPYEVPEWYIGYEEYLKGSNLSNFL